MALFQHLSSGVNTFIVIAIEFALPRYDQLCSEIMRGPVDEKRQCLMEFCHRLT